MRLTLKHPVNGKLKLLLLDNDPTWINSTTEFFIDRDLSEEIEIESALNTKEANKLIKKTSYNIILVDLYLKERTSGDEWILKNINKIDNALIYLISGREQITIDTSRLTELEKKGIDFLKKATPAEIELLKRIVEFIRSDKEEETKIFAANNLGLEIANHAKDIFIKWLQKRKDQDLKNLHVGSTQLSIKELIDHVQKNTKIGRRFLKMFLNWMERRID